MPLIGPAAAGRGNLGGGRTAVVRLVRGVGCGIAQHGLDGGSQGFEPDEAGKHRLVADGIGEHERRALVDPMGEELLRAGVHPGADGGGSGGRRRGTSALSDCRLAAAACWLLMQRHGKALPSLQRGPAHSLSMYFSKYTIWSPILVAAPGAAAATNRAAARRLF